MKKLIAPINILVLTNLILILIVLSYIFSWESTGFVMQRIPQENGVTIIPGKTLWDWMQLFIIPLALIVGGYFLNRSENRKAELIAQNQNEETALAEYIDRISELMLKEELLNSEEESPKRHVARNRTITILRRLNPHRIGIVFDFLKESKIVSTIIPGKDISLYKEAGLEVNREGIIDFFGADLTGLNLKDIWISNMDLRGVKLSKANLENVGFNDCDLEHAIIEDANLKNASFHDCNLEWVTFNGSNFEKSFLTNNKVSDAFFSWCSFKKASIKEQKFDNAYIDNADFSKTKLLSHQIALAKWHSEIPILPKGISMQPESKVELNLNDME